MMLIHHLSLCESESFVPVGFLSLIESDQPDFFESLIEPESRCFFAESESHDDSESEPCDGLMPMDVYYGQKNLSTPTMASTTFL